MPNHVTNNCTVTGDCMAVFRLAFAPATEEDDEGGFTLNKIVPMPDLLRQTESGTNSDWGLSLIGVPNRMNLNSHPRWSRASFDALPQDQKDEVINKTLKSVEAMLRYGHTNWYDWSVANWGTKWDAYSQDWQEPKEGQTVWFFTFDTAWSPPEAAFVALSKMLPKGTRMIVQWQDEGGPWGSYNITKDSVVAGPGGISDVLGEEEENPCTDASGHQWVTRDDNAEVSYCSTCGASET